MKVHVAELRLADIQRMRRRLMLEYLDRYLPDWIRRDGLRRLSLQQLRTALIDVRRSYHKRGY